MLYELQVTFLKLSISISVNRIIKEQKLSEGINHFALKVDKLIKDSQSKMVKENFTMQQGSKYTTLERSKYGKFPTCKILMRDTFQRQTNHHILCSCFKSPSMHMMH